MGALMKKGNKRITKKELFSDWENYQWGTYFSIQNLSGNWVKKCYEGNICPHCKEYVKPILSKSTKDGNVCYVWMANDSHNDKVFCDNQHRKEYVSEFGHRVIDDSCEIGPVEEFLSPRLKGNYNNYRLKVPLNFYGYRGGATA